MIPWEVLDSAPIPGSRDELSLVRRGTEFSIRVDNEELMNSRSHASEEALARIACCRIATRRRPHVLVGGLGMGYTLSAALRELESDAEVLLVELSPAVVAWNRGPLADLAGRPLEDGRVNVLEGDVAKILRAAHACYDSILLDVDNGPESFTRGGNDWLYGKSGLAAAFRALRPRGVFAVWSATPDRRFAARLCRTGFKVEDFCVPARGDRGGPDHTIWIAETPG
jgi:spermidine synthase